MCSARKNFNGAKIISIRFTSPAICIRSSLIASSRYSVAANRRRIDYGVSVNLIHETKTWLHRDSTSVSFKANL